MKKVYKKRFIKKKVYNEKGLLRKILLRKRFIKKKVYKVKGL